MVFGLGFARNKQKKACVLEKLCCAFLARILKNLRYYKEMGFAGGKQAQSALIVTTALPRYSGASQAKVVSNTYEVLGCNVAVLLCARKNRVYISSIGVIAERSD